MNLFTKITIAIIVLIVIAGIFISIGGPMLLIKSMSGSGSSGF